MSLCNPTRTIHAEFEAGHARLLTAWSKRWPELRAYYESIMRSKIKEPVWTASQMVASSALSAAKEALLTAAEGTPLTLALQPQEALVSTTTT